MFKQLLNPVRNVFIVNLQNLLRKKLLQKLLRRIGFILQSKGIQNPNIVSSINLNVCFYIVACY
jgi:hypothetical protein